MPSTANPVSAYSVSAKAGVDVSMVYTVTASSTPEYPGPPFQTGDVTFGQYGSEYVFVQATTSITFYDFVCITGLNAAASLTTTTLGGTGGVRIGLAPPNTNNAGQPNPTIAAGTYFWAAINGSRLLGTTSTTAVAGLQMFSSSTAGILTTITGTLLYAVGGVALQLTTAITGTNASTQLAYFTLSWPRVVEVIDTANGSFSKILGEPALATGWQAP